MDSDANESSGDVLTSTMGGVLSGGGDEPAEKTESAPAVDSVPSSSSDASNVDPAIRKKLPDDPISSTSDVGDRVDFGVRENDALSSDESRRPYIKSDLDNEVEMFASECNLTNISADKITENVEDIVSDLENLLGSYSSLPLNKNRSDDVVPDLDDDLLFNVTSFDEKKTEKDSISDKISTKDSDKSASTSSDKASSPPTVHLGESAEEPQCKYVKEESQTSDATAAVIEAPVVPSETSAEVLDESEKTSSPSSVHDDKPIIPLLVEEEKPESKESETKDTDTNSDDKDKEVDVKGHQTAVDSSIVENSLPATESTHEVIENPIVPSSYKESDNCQSQTTDVSKVSEDAESEAKVVKESTNIPSPTKAESSEENIDETVSSTMHIVSSNSSRTLNEPIIETQTICDASRETSSEKKEDLTRSNSLEASEDVTKRLETLKPEETTDNSATAANDNKQVESKEADIVMPEPKEHDSVGSINVPEKTPVVASGVQEEVEIASEPKQQEPEESQNVVEIPKLDKPHEQAEVPQSRKEEEQTGISKLIPQEDEVSTEQETVEHENIKPSDEIAEDPKKISEKLSSRQDDFQKSILEELENAMKSDDIEGSDDYVSDVEEPKVKRTTEDKGKAVAVLELEDIGTTDSPEITPPEVQDTEESAETLSRFEAVQETNIDPEPEIAENDVNNENEKVETTAAALQDEKQSSVDEKEEETTTIAKLHDPKQVSIYRQEEKTTTAGTLQDDRQSPIDEKEEETTIAGTLQNERQSPMDEKEEETTIAATLQGEKQSIDEREEEKTTAATLHDEKQSSIDEIVEKTTTPARLQDEKQSPIDEKQKETTPVATLHDEKQSSIDEMDKETTAATLQDEKQSSVDEMEQESTTADALQGEKQSIDERVEETTPAATLHDVKQSSIDEMKEESATAAALQDAKHSTIEEREEETTTAETLQDEKQSSVDEMEQETSTTDALPDEKKSSVNEMEQETTTAAALQGKKQSSINEMEETITTAATTQDKEQSLIVEKVEETAAVTLQDDKQSSIDEMEEEPTTACTLQDKKPSSVDEKEEETTIAAKEEETTTISTLEDKKQPSSDDKEEKTSVSTLHDEQQSSNDEKEEETTMTVSLHEEKQILTIKEPMEAQVQTISESSAIAETEADSKEANAQIMEFTSDTGRSEIDKTCVEHVESIANEECVKLDIPLVGESVPAKESDKIASGIQETNEPRDVRQVTVDPTDPQESVNMDTAEGTMEPKPQADLQEANESIYKMETTAEVVEKEGLVQEGEVKATVEVESEAVEEKIETCDDTPIAEKQVTLKEDNPESANEVTEDLKADDIAEVSNVEEKEESEEVVAQERSDLDNKLEKQEVLQQDKTEVAEVLLKEEQLTNVVTDQKEIPTSEKQAEVVEASEEVAMDTSEDRAEVIGSEVTLEASDERSQPSDTQKEISPKVADEGPQPSEAQKEISPKVADEGPRPSETQKEISPKVADEGPKPSESQKEISPNVADERPQPTKTQKEISPEVADKGPQPSETQKEMSPIVTDDEVDSCKAKSKLLTENELTDEAFNVKDSTASCSDVASTVTPIETAEGGPKKSEMTPSTDVEMETKPEKGSYDALQNVPVDEPIAESNVLDASDIVPSLIKEESEEDEKSATDSTAMQVTSEIVDEVREASEDAKETSESVDEMKREDSDEAGATPSEIVESVEMEEPKEEVPLISSDVTEVEPDVTSGGDEEISKNDSDVKPTVNAEDEAPDKSGDTIQSIANEESLEEVSDKNSSDNATVLCKVTTEESEKQDNDENVNDATCVEEKIQEDLGAESSNISAVEVKDDEDVCSTLPEETSVAVSEKSSIDSEITEPQVTSAACEETSVEENTEDEDVPNVETKASSLEKEKYLVQEERSIDECIDDASYVTPESAVKEDKVQNMEFESISPEIVSNSADEAREVPMAASANSPAQVESDITKESKDDEAKESDSKIVTSDLLPEVAKDNISKEKTEDADKCKAGVIMKPDGDKNDQKSQESMAIEPETVAKDADKAHKPKASDSKHEPLKTTVLNKEDSITATKENLIVKKDVEKVQLEITTDSSKALHADVKDTVDNMFTADSNDSKPRTLDIVVKSEHKTEKAISEPKGDSQSTEKVDKKEPSDKVESKDSKEKVEHTVNEPAQSTVDGGEPQEISVTANVQSLPKEILPINTEEKSEQLVIKSNEDKVDKVVTETVVDKGSADVEKKTVKSQESTVFDKKVESTSQTSSGKIKESKRPDTDNQKSENFASKVENIEALADSQESKIVPKDATESKNDVISTKSTSLVKKVDVPNKAIGDSKKIHKEDLKTVVSSTPDADKPAETNKADLGLQDSKTSTDAESKQTEASIKASREKADGNKKKVFSDTVTDSRKIKGLLPDKKETSVSVEQNVQDISKGKEEKASEGNEKMNEKEKVVDEKINSISIPSTDNKEDKDGKENSITLESDKVTSEYKIGDVGRKQTAPVRGSYTRGRRRKRGASRLTMRTTRGRKRKIAPDNEASAISKEMKMDKTISDSSKTADLVIQSWNTVSKPSNIGETSLDKENPEKVVEISNVTGRPKRTRKRRNWDIENFGDQPAKRPATRTRSKQNNDEANKVTLTNEPKPLENNKQVQSGSKETISQESIVSAETEVSSAVENEAEPESSNRDAAEFEDELVKAALEASSSSSVELEAEISSMEEIENKEEYTDKTSVKSLQMEQEKNEELALIQAAQESRSRDIENSPARLMVKSKEAETTQDKSVKRLCNSTEKYQKPLNIVVEQNINVSVVKEAESTTNEDHEIVQKELSSDDDKVEEYSSKMSQSQELKMTITKNKSEETSSILKIFDPKNPGHVEISHSESETESEETPIPKLIIKQSPKMLSPLKITIKPVVKPEEQQTQKSSPKLIIKPIVKPDEEAKHVDERHHSPKITIKPIPKPTEDSERCNSPKITIKPIIKPCEASTSPKIKIKPIVKPEEEALVEDDESKERIVLKINKSNIPQKEAKKNEETEKLAKIKLKFSKEGGHAHIVNEDVAGSDKVPFKRPNMEEPEVDTKKFKADHSKLEQSAFAENVPSEACSTPDATNDGVFSPGMEGSTPEITPPLPRKRGRPRKLPLKIREDFKDPNPVPEAVPTRSPRRSRGRGSRSAVESPVAVPIETTIPIPTMEEPPVMFAPEVPASAPPTEYNTGRPKRSCRGPSVTMTLGIKPRKPRQPRGVSMRLRSTRGRGGNHGVRGGKVEKPPKKEKITESKLKLIKEAAITARVTESLENQDVVMSVEEIVSEPAVLEEPVVVEEVKETKEEISESAVLVEPVTVEETVVATVPEEPPTVTLPDVIIIEEETRMSAETISRAETPPKQEITQDVVVEESQSSVQSTATTESTKARKGHRMEVQPEPESSIIVSAEQLAEYYWAGGGPYMLQEQVAQFLGIKSFKRKYPGIPRRSVDMQERDYLRETGLTSEHMCDLGLTAVNSADILDIMYTDFQQKYEEYCKYQREKQTKDIANKQKALSLAASQEKNKLDIMQAAIESAAQWNTTFNKSRREDRKACMDLQTFTINYPKGNAKQITKPKIGHYPIALVPGQYTDYYKTYTPTEINNLPLNSMLYNPIHPHNEEDSQSDGSGSDSESSTSGSGSSESDSSEDDCNICSNSSSVTSKRAVV